ncbi:MULTISPECIES: HNH endonuclease signature motif containing protein [Campylobacter]|uniref:HNH endonuclease signature motif containing protein n=1 Tax=Campylobacter TaxID=194 RepID=UPI000A337BF8|nr:MULTISPECIES: HNH endonuclease signature motif containing protein [Campylobacter]MCI7364802.1 HNH endonuclease [Campylobacter lanienae]MCR8679278.1 HNH endonuclease [Campylobacter sp. RM19072]MCR8696662.1 HNH endonuclease [Campylobacter sp. RM19073]
MKVSEFLNNTQSPFVLGAFFSRYVIEKGFIQTISQYKSTKFLDDSIYKSSLPLYLDALNYQSSDRIWEYKSKTSFQIVLENDLDLNNDRFYKLLLRKIMLSPFFIGEILDDDKKEFIRGFFEIRGSVDTSRPYLSQDYFYNSELELKRLRLLIDNFNIPEEAFNINFRELQSQFVSGENRRNTQFRINLFWYIKNIGLINEYKAKIIKEVYGINYKRNIDEIFYFECEEPSFTKAMINERLGFYLNTIYGKNLSNYEIDKIRKDLEFEEEKNDKFKRDVNIVKFMRIYAPDICAGCNDIYNIKDRSFLTRQNRYYTEIHHCISVGKDKELDVLENLVKLCPTCHRALGKGSSSAEYQKELIKRILNSNQQNLEFAKIIFASDDINILVEKIQENLK